jgi:hypothetical protein
MAGDRAAEDLTETELGTAAFSWICLACQCVRSQVPDEIELCIFPKPDHTRTTGAISPQDETRRRAMPVSPPQTGTRRRKMPQFTTDLNM